MEPVAGRLVLAEVMTMVAAPEQAQAIPTTGQSPGESPDVESFYHLRDVEIAQSTCQGLACFVARHLDPQRWAHAATREPRVYCLGKCYAGPASGDDDPKP